MDISGTFDIIYADPPWDYNGRQQHNKYYGNKSACHHYSCMKLSQLKELPVESIAAPDSLLFLWTSSPHLPQAIELMKSWGFDYKTIAFVWDKQRVNPSYYTLSQVEICLVGKRGRIPKPYTRTIRQFYSQMREQHSKKPDEIRNRIARMFPTQSKIEIFAREEHEGWVSWGNEVGEE
jgi:N6-adenosine-specific RNA methylase IME4